MLINSADAVAALQRLVATHPLLPAAHLIVDPDVSADITVQLHGGFSDFEAWREALGASDVRFASYTEGTSLRAGAEIDGMKVQLIGYSIPLPQDVKAVA